MNVSRRSFLKGLLALPLIPLLKKEDVTVAKIEEPRQIVKNYKTDNFDPYADEFIRPAMEQVARRMDEDLMKIYRGRRI